MRLITVAGPPSSGKTSVILRLADVLREKNQNIGLVMFDCLTPLTASVTLSTAFRYRSGLSESSVPITSLSVTWKTPSAGGVQEGFDIHLISLLPKAPISNRCSPHIRGVLAVCVSTTSPGSTPP